MREKWILRDGSGEGDKERECLTDVTDTLIGTSQETEAPLVCVEVVGDPSSGCPPPHPSKPQGTIRTGVGVSQGRTRPPRPSVGLLSFSPLTPDGTSPSDPQCDGRESPDQRREGRAGTGYDGPEVQKGRRTNFHPEV